MPTRPKTEALTPEQRYEVTRFLEEGLSYDAYCRKYKVAKSTLNKWVIKFKNETKEAS